MPTYLEYIGALSPRKGVGPSLRFPGFQTKPAAGAFNRGSGGMGEGALGAFTGGGGGGGDDDAVDDPQPKDPVDPEPKDPVDPEPKDPVDPEPKDPVDSQPKDTNPGVLITPTKTPPNDGNQITWLDELPKGAQNIVIKMLEMNPDADVSKDRILAEYYYDGKANDRRISAFYRDYYNWRRDNAIAKSKNKTDSSSTVSTNLNEQPDGTVRPGADPTKITDTTSTTTGGTDTTSTTTTSGTDTNTTSGSTPAKKAREDEDLATSPGSTTKNQPKAGDFGVLSTGGKDEETKTDAELPESVKNVLIDLGVLDASGNWSRPDITIDTGTATNPGAKILVNGKTVPQAILDEIEKKFPEILTDAPANPFPAGSSHILVGGSQGVGGSQVGAAIPVNPGAGGIVGDPVVYGNIDANDVEEMRRNPFGWLMNKAKQVGGGLRDAWLDVKDSIGDLLSPEEKEALENASNQGNQTTPTFSGYTDPTGVSDWYKDSTTKYETDPRWHPSAVAGRSPLSDFGVQPGLAGAKRGLPYNKFPLDGGQSEVLGEVLIDKMSPDPNTLQSEIDRMVARDLPFVSVTADDGTPMMYDKETGQTLSLPDYGALVQKRNTIGLPGSGGYMPRRNPGLPGYRMSGIGGGF